MESRVSVPPAEPGLPPSDHTKAGPFDVGTPEPAVVDLAELDDPRTLQILSTEHWSLLAGRSLTWNESFSRTGLFLSVLSASVVALGLVGGATQFGEGFTVFALVLLPVTLFVGVATFVRLDEVNLEDYFWVAGMNRIRNAYVRMRPSIEPFLIEGWSDDTEGIARTFLMERHPTVINTFVHQFITTPGMVAVIDGVLAASIAGIVLWKMDTGMGVSIPLVIVIGAITTGVLFVTSYRRSKRVFATWRPRFPMTDPEAGASVAPARSREP